MLEVDETLLNEAGEYLRKTAKGWEAGVCLGKCIYLDGKDKGELVYKAPHTACHSWVTCSYGIACFGSKGYFYDWNRKYAKNARNFLTLTCHSRKRSKSVCSPEASDFLIKWMARESPFSQFILNRDDDETLCEGGAILLCGPDGLTLPQAMWVCKILRFTTEGSKAADTFMTLVKGGVDPMLAVLVASHVRSVKGAVFGYTGVEGHSTVFQYGDRTDVVALVSRELNPTANDTSTVFKTSKIVKARGKKSDPLSNPTTKIKGFCKPYKKPDGWGGYLTGEGAEGPDLVKHVLEWEREIKDCLQPEPPPALPDSSTVYLDLDM